MGYDRSVTLKTVAAVLGGKVLAVARTVEVVASANACFAELLITVREIGPASAVDGVIAIAGSVLFDTFPVTGNALPYATTRQARVFLRFAGREEGVSEGRFNDEHDVPLRERLSLA
jgi:hypothetical protein